ncbi:MAG TPA: hypothetical protein VF500_26195 [Mucilaginibacter sp.]
MKPCHLALYILVAFLLISFGACSNSNQGTSKQNGADSSKHKILYHKKNFDSLMVVVEKHAESGLDVSEALLADSAFLEIFEHGEAYFEDVNKHLLQERFTHTEGGIWIYAMQNLSVSNYVQLCHSYYLLYRHGKIPEIMFETIISPNFLRKHIIGKNYQNPEVAKFLNGVLHDNHISKQLVVIVDDMLKGKFSGDEAVDS